MRWPPAPVAIAAALVLLTPVVAFDVAQVPARSTESVTTPAPSSYLGVTNLFPSASSPAIYSGQGGWTREVLVVKHQYVAGSTLQVDGALEVNPQGRFALVGLPATLAQDQTVHVSVKDEGTCSGRSCGKQSSHPPFCTSVVVRIDALILGSTSARAGKATTRETVYVATQTGC